MSDVFNAIQYRSYLPGGGLPRPNPAALPSQALPYDDQPMALGQPAQNGSRKRSYQDRGDVQMQDATEYYSNNARSFKQPRRGRGGRMDDANGFRHGAAAGGYPAAGVYQVPPTYGAPTPGAQQQPFDPNIFDSNNPMEAIMRLQSMGVPLPPLPPFPQQPMGGGSALRRRPRCRDYDTKGYCARGNNCHFEHGTDSIFVPPVMPSPGNEGTSICYKHCSADLANLWNRIRSSKCRHAHVPPDTHPLPAIPHEQQHATALATQRKTALP